MGYSIRFEVWKVNFDPAVTGRVSKVHLPYVQEHAVVASRANCRKHRKIEQPAILIPGPKKPLRVGVDDDQIQVASQSNLWDLEDERTDATRVRNFYVVTMESLVAGLTLDEQPPEPIMVTRPFNLILAKDMLEAIHTFEDENGRRNWIPDGNRFEAQIGVPRVENKITRLVRIQRMRKDCVLGVN